MTGREVLTRLAEIVDPRQIPHRRHGPRADQVDMAEYRRWAVRNHDLASRLFYEIRAEVEAEENRRSLAS